MSQSIKQIKNRIRSVENTKKVTGAMQMISVVKLNRIEDQLFALRPYALRMENLMYNLAGLSDQLASEYFNKRSSDSDIVLCLITSDNGLCGMYNQNVIRLAEEFLQNNQRQKVKLIVVGQKGLSYFRSRQVEIYNSYIGLNAKFTQNFCDKITAELSQLFLSGKAGSVYLAYTYFENSLMQKAILQRLLSIEPRKAEPEEYIAEPDLKSILTDLIPKYLLIKMRLVFLEAFTSEHAARTISMKTATDNARELLEGLVLLRNKVRQAGITQDILEITSSAEALRG
ncbi:MAG: ATP synthase F1 subunit gamma [Candidatus Omnitrophica bacterium]|jgi:F-type H+-transporting ATPase subunit gamma|nr:ATP synthase F1 subunit gamma [Candidatus Omnitrophota bacterium]